MTAIFSTTDRDKFFDQLKERYGAQLEFITPDEKKLFRAALASFVALKVIWNDEGVFICMGDCIGWAGLAWDGKPELCGYINHCADLSDRDIEGLIESLTAQLKEGL